MAFKFRPKWTITDFDFSGSAFPTDNRPQRHFAKHSTFSRYCRCISAGFRAKSLPRKLTHGASQWEESIPSRDAAMYLNVPDCWLQNCNASRPCMDVLWTSVSAWDKGATPAKHRACAKEEIETLKKPTQVNGDRNPQAPWNLAGTARPG